MQGLKQTFQPTSYIDFSRSAIIDCVFTYKSRGWVQLKLSVKKAERLMLHAAGIWRDHGTFWVDFLIPRRSFRLETTLLGLPIKTEASISIPFLPSLLWRYSMLNQTVWRTHIALVRILSMFIIFKLDIFNLSGFLSKKFHLSFISENILFCCVCISLDYELS